MDPNLQFSEEMGTQLTETERYRKLVAALIHRTNCTRPNIRVSVCDLTRFIQSPRDSHWTTAMDSLRYIMGSATLTLTH